jgi:hypothetical protein
MTTTRRNTSPLVLTDPDGGILECRELLDADAASLGLFVMQEGEVAGLDLDRAAARELRDFLNAFLWRHDDA